MKTVKITKYVHSCVLVETDDYTVLLDPGKYSWESKLFDIKSLQKLDAIAITHEHYDHFSEQFVAALLKKFPKVCILSTPAVGRVLRDIFKDDVTLSTHPALKTFKSKHNKLAFDFPTPQNIGVHVDDIFTHPGDSNTFKKTKAILAMPMTAPWGSMTASTKKIDMLKPKVVLPIHDWHWRPEELMNFYQTCESVYEKKGIRFINPTNGKTEVVKLD